jgi:hypothetical protein
MTVRIRGKAKLAVAQNLHDDLGMYSLVQSQALQTTLLTPHHCKLFGQARITVTLATGIPADVCGEVNLGYLDPRSIDIATWSQNQNEDMLVVPHAGEILYRLAT